MKTLISILFIKAFLMMAFIQWGTIGLGPDEAQYWTWSQELDWGYYSKPPAIAWEIWLGCQLFGSSELGVRFGAVILSFFLAYAVYFLARSAELDEKRSFFAALMLALSPMGILSSLFATTDCGYVLFWTLALALLIRKKEPDFILLGLIVFLGALFKWPIYYIWPIALLIPKWRSPKLLISVGISLIALLPSIYWNSTHDWSTFRHVGATIMATKGSDYHGPVGNPLDFFGAQAVLASPILFVALLFAFVYIVRNWKNTSPQIKFVGILTFAILFIYQLLSFVQKIQGNWAIFAYPTAFVVLAWYLSRKWVIAGLTLSVALMTLIFLVPLPYKVNPFRHNIGWRNISYVLTQAGYDPQKDFLFSDNYQMTSILSFYGPEQKRAYFLNIGGRRKNQYSYWPGMLEKEVGKIGYTLFAGNRINDAQKEKLQKGFLPYFDKISILNTYPVSIFPEKVAVIYKGINYNGLEPKEPELY